MSTSLTHLHAHMLTGLSDMGLSDLSGSETIVLVMCLLVLVSMLMSLVLVLVLLVWGAFQFVVWLVTLAFSSRARSELLKTLSGIKSRMRATAASLSGSRRE